MTRRILWFVLLILLAAPAWADDYSSQSREILDQPEYRGYRVVPPHEGSGGHWNPDGSANAEAQDAEGGAGAPKRGARAEARRPENRRQSSGGSDGTITPMPAWVANLLWIMMWIVIVAVGVVVVAAIAYAIYKLVTDRRGAKTKKAKATKSKTQAENTEDELPEDEPHDELAGIFGDALAAARKEYEDALSNEDYAKAALLRYRIFWLEAGWRGCVESSDVKTWRDALRMVRRRELRQRVRRLLALVERVRYGAYTPDKSEFMQWRNEIDDIPSGGVLQ
jgi:hypothetical protein